MLTIAQNRPKTTRVWPGTTAMRYAVKMFVMRPCMKSKQRQQYFPLYWTDGTHRDSHGYEAHGRLQRVQQLYFLEEQRNEVGNSIEAPPPEEDDKDDRAHTRSGLCPHAHGQKHRLITGLTAELPKYEANDQHNSRAKQRRNKRCSPSFWCRSGFTASRVKSCSTRVMTRCKIGSTYAKSHTRSPSPVVPSSAPTQSSPLLYLMDMSSGGRDIHPRTTKMQPRPAWSQKIVLQEAEESLRIPPARC